MKSTIVYDEKQNTQRGNWLGCNLSDLVHCLDKNLRRSHSARVEASFLPGRVEIEVVGAGLEDVKPTMEAFQRSMVKKHGFRLLITYT